MIKKNIVILIFVAFIISLGSIVASAGEVDWGAINPKQKNATSVGDSKECLLCHQEYIDTFGRTKHAKVFQAKYGKELGGTCEKCHGPLSAHLNGATREERYAAVVSFKKIPTETKNKICLQCHEKGLTMHWAGSTHDRNGLSCSDCHYVMDKKSRQKLYIDEDPKKACFQCHQGIRAKMMKTSHMPIREGKLECASCHNPHGGPGPSLLKGTTINDTCYNCHQEKRAPVIWEHAPVRENCANCHDAHGSNFDKLLKVRMPYLCQQCHSGNFHPSTMYDGGKVVSSAQFMRGKSCVNCHSLIHGSNHPSGSFFQR